MTPITSMSPGPGQKFIGRRPELDALNAALECAIAGQPRIVLLAGEPGIGKTRTAQEIVNHATQKDVLALCGRCLEEPGAPPYWPWLQLIRRYAAPSDEAVLHDVIGTAAPYLAALDPELLRRPFDRTPAPADTDAAMARFRLFDAIAGLWQRAAARQPLLLVLDDLHWADVPSLRLLEFVMAEAAGSRLMVVGTYRDAEVTRQHPLSDTLAQLHRHAHVQRLLLGGFSPAETAEFVAAASGVDASELAAMLHDQTEGHPLFLTELAREIFRSRDPRSTTLATARAAVRRVPKGVRDIIGARLNRLTPSAISALQNAAIVGREFRFDLLRRLLEDMSEEQCLAAMEEASVAGLIDDAGEPGTYQFTHALVRDTLYDELPAPRRARLHQQIAATLEVLHAGDLTACLSALAYHHHAAGPAGDPAKAIEFATLAAERATAMQAHEEAARHYRLACESVPATASTDARRCRLLLGLGHAQNSAGDSTLALSTFMQAAEHARRAGETSLLARAAIGFGDTQWRLGIEGSTAVALIREALAQSAPAATRERASLLTALCLALLFSERQVEAEAAFREAVAMARGCGDPWTLFRALSAILPDRSPERLQLRIAAAREAIALTQRAGHPEWVVPYLTGWHIGDLMESGDTAAATATARLHLTTGTTSREPFLEAVALAALSMIAAHEGRFAEAEQLAMRAVRCGTRFDRANAAGIFSVQMFTIRRQQGRLGELTPILKQFLDSGSAAATWRPGLAILHCELGARDEARAIFEMLATDDFASIANDAIRIASIAYLAETCAWLNDAAHASTLYDLLLPYAERNIVFGAHSASFGAAARILGMLAATLERWEDAERRFEYAIAFDTRTGGRPWLARSRCEFAAMLLRRGRASDLDRTTQLLAAALVDARALGMHGLEQRIVALQAQPSAAGIQDVRSRAKRIAGLSEREVQVLRLIAAGMTNQQIADHLSRSPSTVAIHVRNILGKTQAANRAEAAAFAVRHGLIAHG